jgi:hypothetical protein
MCNMTQLQYHSNFELKKFYTEYKAKKWISYGKPKALQK